MICHPAVPERYRSEFLARETSLVKNRLRLLCATVIALYFVTLLLDLFLRPHLFNPKEIPFSGFLLLGGALILLANERARSLQAAKFNAYLFAGFLLLLLVKLGFVYPEQASLSAAYYLLLLFFVSLVIPWTVLESLGLSVMTLGAFMTYYALMKHLAVEVSPAYFPPDRYIDGLFLIAVSAAMCVVIRKNESARDAENFALLKEVEEKNEQIQKELELARRIHRTLIPESVSTARADIAVTYLPVHFVGGDYAKFRFLADERLIFIISDVTGHGVPAALLVNRVHAEFESLARDGKDPGVLLKELDDFITEDFEGTNMYLTAFCGLLDFKSMAFLYSNYGHPPQYILHATCGEVRCLASQTTLLGLTAKRDGIHQSEIRFDRGDRILLFTDGLLEATGDHDLGRESARLESFLKTNDHLVPRAFHERLLDEMGGSPKGDAKDDIFLLSIKVH